MLQLVKVYPKPCSDAPSPCSLCEPTKACTLALGDIRVLLARAGHAARRMQESSPRILVVEGPGGIPVRVLKSCLVRTSPSAHLLCSVLGSWVLGQGKERSLLY